MDLAPSPNVGTSSSPITSVEYKTLAFTIGASDIGKLFICNGNFDVSLTAAATLGATFYFYLQNFGTSAVTIRPDAADDMGEANGLGGFLLNNRGDSVMIICAGDPSSGWNWHPIGGNSVYKLLSYYPAIAKSPATYNDAMLIPVVASGLERWKSMSLETALLQPAFAANRNNVVQTGVATATPTKVAHTTEVYDPFGEFDSATNYRYTPMQAGKYLVVASVEVNAMTATANYANSYVYKNGSLYARGRDWGANGASSDVIPVCTTIVDMNGSTDYLEHYVYQNDGGTRSLSGDIEATYFTACRVST